jgi:hypothetical protein
MDTDYTGLPIRKYTTPIEDVQSTMGGGLSSPAPFRHVARSSFERLPLELRQMVYSHLGYPVAGKVWIQDPHDYRFRLHASIEHLEFWRWDVTLLKWGSWNGLQALYEHSLLNTFYPRYHVVS